MFYFYPYLGKWSNLTNMFQVGWNHQLDYIINAFTTCGIMMFIVFQITFMTDGPMVVDLMSPFYIVLPPWNFLTPVLYPHE